LIHLFNKLDIYYLLFSTYWKKDSKKEFINKYSFLCIITSWKKDSKNSNSREIILYFYLFLGNILSEIEFYKF
jgi:hypothetical protein